MRGLYDLVFGYEDADPDRPAFGAGLTLFLTGLVLFEYKGAIFWKMTAGMGDVVIAPLYQALRRRGVEFEFFHRLDALHLDDRHTASMRSPWARQVQLADGIDRLRTPDHRARTTRLSRAHRWRINSTLPQHRRRLRLESIWAASRRRDAGLRRGVDFDHVVLAVSSGMLRGRRTELIDDRPEWRDMTMHVRTVATQAFQIWLRTRPNRHSVGDRPGVTDQRVHVAVRDLGVDASDAVGRRLARLTTGRARSPTSAAPRGAVADDRELRDYARDLRTRVAPTPSSYFDRQVGLHLPTPSPRTGSRGIC